MLHKQCEKAPTRETAQSAAGGQGSPRQGTGLQSSLVPEAYVQLYPPTAASAPTTLVSRTPLMLMPVHGSDAAQ